jgi:2-oxoisovalerate dehydrogenase E1 component
MKAPGARHLHPAPPPDAAEERRKLSEAQALARMLLIRAVEERLLSLFSEGKLFGTTHTCIGQETCAVGVVGALDLDRDVIFSSHRCHGHFLMYTDTPPALLAEIMGRQTGACGGRGGSQHLCVRNFYSNGVQGGIVPVATGVALAEKRKGSGAVTVCFLGDGTLGEGVIYEAFNMASLWRIPILYVLEHNGYAQSTPTAITTAGDVAARAAAFGIATDRRPADDPVTLTAYMQGVVERVRRDGAPFFQVLDTYRLAAHSKGDDHRERREIERYRQADPLVHLRRSVGEGLAAELAEVAQARVEAAVTAAEAAPYAVVDPDAEARAFEQRGHAAGIAPAFAHAAADPSQLVVQNLNAALHALMTKHGDVLLLGEDVLDPYGGAFKVSRGLSTAFPQRVLATPISEAGIVGLGTGLSLRGQRPIIEIMFGDFLALGADQILNHLAKFRWMYNEQVETPVVIRTPVGGRRGYGPTHSQSLEKMFLGIPGLVVVAISSRHDPGELLRRAAICDARPVLFLEQKILYAKRLAIEPPAGLVFELPASERDALYPTGVWAPAGLPADVTVVTYGAVTEIVEAAITRIFEEDEVVAEYIVPSQLAPLRSEPIVESVRRSGRLVVVEEGTGPWGFGAEVVARVSEALRGHPPGCARVAAHPLPIPNARPAEEAVLPSVERVMEAMRSVMR